MSANIDDLKFETAVVAACESQDGAVALCKGQNGTAVKNSLELGRSFTFEAKYTPPALLLFRLSISLTKETTLYLQFKPSVISSLAKFTCDAKSKNLPSYFDTIQRHLHHHRSFTRLQFKLNNHGDLITPVGFAIDNHTTESRSTFASITSLATAASFSLYMPRDVLTTAKYKEFYRIWRQLTDPTELRCMYNGVGGALFSLENCNRPYNPTAEAITAVAPTACPPVYDFPPQYNTIEEQSTASESDAATIPVSTPSGYRDDDEGHGVEIPDNVQGYPGKRHYSSDSDNIEQRRVSKRTYQKQAAASPQPKSLGPDPLSLRKAVETLESRIETQQQQIEALKAAMCTLRDQGEDLEERRTDTEGRQDGMDETLELLGARIIEVEQDCDTLQEQLPEMRQGIEACQDRVEEYAENWVEENLGPIFDKFVEKYLEDKAEGFMADLKKKFRSVLDD
ncbi:hypothetical protein PG985_006719 [Apiospora marii]|uniref:Uncharacterized protein n=1 Tax=Apiospora marii TaxID=335849 RepID=A0ABR1S9R7_9PEZI